MKFLQKIADSALLQSRWDYNLPRDRAFIRKTLLVEQKGFCAYTEHFFRQAETKCIEHFFPKNEYPEKVNDYENLYVITSWQNENKAKKIQRFLPILAPNSSEITQRIRYKVGEYRFDCVEEGDVEAKNLIDFIGLNAPDLVLDRQRQIERIQKVAQMCKYDTNYLRTKLAEDKSYLSFITIIENELNIELTSLLN